MALSRAPRREHAVGMLLHAHLLPGLCVLCRGPARGSRFCAGCRADLPQTGPACPRCAEPLALATALPCPACQRSPPPWDRCIAALPYAWPVDSALKALKYSGQLVYSAAFGELLPPIAAREFADCDALCPVPLYRLRQALRGYNQATELCRSLLAAGWPLQRGLYRVRHTKAQSGLGRAARRRNLCAAFRVRTNLEGRRLLIVDDVMTTGETCRQFAAALLAAGAARVDVLVVARAAGDPQAAGASKV